MTEKDQCTQGMLKLVADLGMDTVLKALSSRTRREILVLLATNATGDAVGCCDPQGQCANSFVEKLKLGAPTVSHHMKILAEAGLVSSEKRGLWVYYQLQPAPLLALAENLNALVGELAESRCGRGQSAPLPGMPRVQRSLH